MSQNETGSGLGLDVGTSRIVVARRTGGDRVYDSQLNAFVSIPYSRITAAALVREDVPHTVEAQQILVHGNESEKFAGLLNAEIRRPMTGGRAGSQGAGGSQGDPRDPLPHAHREATAQDLLYRARRAAGRGGLR